MGRFKLGGGGDDSSTIGKMLVWSFALETACLKKAVEKKNQPKRKKTNHCGSKKKFSSLKKPKKKTTDGSFDEALQIL